MKNKKRVVLLCPYSAPSACGIWSRVYSDARNLVKEGFEVHILSSNIIKGTDQLSPAYEETEDGVFIHRFKVKFKVGRNALFWFPTSTLKKLNPDLIHTHGYRHPHSLQAFLFAKKNKIPVCITPHGPFEKDNKRSKIFKIIDFLYDKFIGVWELKRYTCVISISKWELKYLESFNVENIELIPNGINSLFLEKKLKLSKKDKVKNKVLYMGRVDPVKRLDWIQYAASKLSDINFLIKGPFQDFEVESTSENLKVENKVFTAQELIKDLDDSDIFVLPSIRESFGIVLIEAMARGKLVISSDTKGANDIIENGVNGFIVINENELVEAIEYSYEHWDKLLSIRENAISTANQYNEEHTVKNLSSTYKKILN